VLLDHKRACTHEWVREIQALHVIRCVVWETFQCQGGVVLVCQNGIVCAMGQSGIVRVGGSLAEDDCWE
jgi:hypothetical protein